MVVALAGFVLGFEVTKDATVDFTCALYVPAEVAARLVLDVNHLSEVQSSLVAFLVEYDDAIKVELVSRFSHMFHEGGFRREVGNLSFVRVRACKERV